MAEKTWLGQKLLETRERYRKAVPLWGRKAIKYGTGWGQAYSALRHTGLGKWLLTPAHAATPPNRSGPTYQKKADGGYNYFVNGHAASLQDFVNSGGIPPKDEPALQYGGRPSGDGTSGGGYGGGGTAGSAEPAKPAFETYYNGVLYTNPESYKNAVSADLLKNYNTQKTILDRQYDSGLITYEQRQKSLDKARTTAMEQIQGYFTAVSPEAYQSAQKGMQQEAQETYQQNTTNLSREKQGWVASVLENIEGLKSDYQNKLDQLSNQLLDFAANPNALGTYTSNITAPSAQTPQSVLGQFNKYNLTQQLYGNALPAIKKFPISTPITKKKVTPLTAALYPETLNI